MITNYVVNFCVVLYIRLDKSNTAMLPLELSLSDKIYNVQWFLVFVSE